MKTKSVFLYCLLLFTITNVGLSQSVLSKKTGEIVSTYIQTNNINQMLVYLNDPVDLTLPGSDNSFSKAQASIILKKFFKDYPVKTYVTHQTGKSVDGAVFVIGRYESSNGKKFRVYYLIKEFSGTPLIYLMEFEEE